MIPRPVDRFGELEYRLDEMPSLTLFGEAPAGRVVELYYSVPVRRRQEIEAGDGYAHGGGGPFADVHQFRVGCDGSRGRPHVDVGLPVRDRRNAVDDERSLVANDGDPDVT